MVQLATIPQVIDAAKNGKPFILVDDENRENEGDIVIPACKVTPEIINFMAKHARGLICMPITQQHSDLMGLHLMAKSNESRHNTPFTVSIEAKQGVTTGISAADRAHTILTAINSNNPQNDIVTPGHIFPLVARDGGVLVRAGHTEAGVDISRLAGLHPSAVICEIMNDDGTMARLPDLLKFAKQHNLLVASIADLISYRLQHDILVEIAHEREFISDFAGKFNMRIYVTKHEYAEHIALIQGNIEPNKPILTRMHAHNILNDVLGDASTGKAGELQKSMQMVNEAGSGVIVIIREPRKNSLTASLGDKPVLRDYGIGAQILRDIGVRKMQLISNSQKPIIGLDGYGLEVVGYQPLQ